MDTELETLVANYSRLSALRFESQRESAFIQRYSDQYRSHITISIYIGIVVFILSGSMDLILVNDRVLEIWKIRYPIFVPMLLIIGLTTYFGVFKQQQQLAICLLVIIVGAAMIRIVENTQGSVSQIYFNGLLLTLMAGLTATRMLFRYAVWTTICIVIMLSLHLGFASKDETRIIIADIYLFAGMAIFSLISNYFLERAQRLSYLKQEIIVHKHEKLVAANEQLATQASTDGLTGINNRRTFDNELTSEWLRAYRERYRLSLLMTDIDFFKKYNDTYGHQAGDDCLRQVACTLSKFANRPGDCVARYGGEEFALILPNTPPADAQRIAAKVVEAIANLRIPHKTSSVSPYVTISVGVATMLPEDRHQMSELIDIADRSLYRAKDVGRNQYMACPE